MYKVLKPKGYSQCVTVENTETLASINIGVINAKILDILDEAEIDYPSAPDEWDTEVNKETANKLVALTLQMKKPIRDQRKTETKEDNKEIDAYDVLFGLASYN